MNELEELVVGSMLHNPEFVPLLLPKIRESMFTDQICRKVFNALGAVLSDGKTPSYSSIEIYCGGAVSASALSLWGNYRATVNEIEEVISFLGESTKKNRMVDAVLQLKTSDEIATAVAAIAAEVEEGSVALIKSKEYSALAQRNILEAEDKLTSPRIYTGFENIDLTVGGFAGGQLILLAARTGIGKSALALNFAHNMAKSSKKVLFVSMEMTASEMAERSLALATGVSIDHQRSGKFSGDDHRKFCDGYKKLNDDQIWWCDEANMTMAKLHSKYHEMNNNIGCEVVIVDYIGLMRAHQRGDSIYREVSEISRDLKNFAAKYKIPVLALAQLNREVSKSTDKRPQLSHLRDSGSLEQDANVVMMLWQNDSDKKDNNEIVCTIAKNRGGKTGDCALRFDRECSRFSDNSIPMISINKILMKDSSPTNAFDALLGVTS